MPRTATFIMMRSHICLLSFLLCPLPSVHSHIWAWMYSMPNPNGNEVAPPKDAGPSSSLGHMVAVCSQESGCPQGSFCDHHFRLCLNLKQEGDYCRQDDHCAQGLNCMFGRCHQIVPSGQEGARCLQDSDCAPDACCARLHGEMVCKHRLSLDDRCYIPQGGIAFSVNQVCPCQEGLVCRRTAVNRETSSEYQPDKSDWRCQKY
ncbi:hypothetical protein lerEdw1_006517 [Lerista edwardsae]|nr:hypothetical protein lerEdw1_006517 [Lerista edwardsae]